MISRQIRVAHDGKYWFHTFRAICKISQNKISSAHPLVPNSFVHSSQYFICQFVLQKKTKDCYWHWTGTVQFAYVFSCRIRGLIAAIRIEELIYLCLLSGDRLLHWKLVPFCELCLSLWFAIRGEIDQKVAELSKVVSTAISKDR